MRLNAVKQQSKSTYLCRLKWGDNAWLDLIVLGSLMYITGRASYLIGRYIKQYHTLSENLHNPEEAWRTIKEEGERSVIRGNAVFSHKGLDYLADLDYLTADFKKESMEIARESRAIAVIITIPISLGCAYFTKKVAESFVYNHIVKEKSGLFKKEEAIAKPVDKERFNWGQNALTDLLVLLCVTSTSSFITQAIHTKCKQRNACSEYLKNPDTAWMNIQDRGEHIKKNGELKGVRLMDIFYPRVHMENEAQQKIFLEKQKKIATATIPVLLPFGIGAMVLSLDLLKDYCFNLYRKISSKDHKGHPQ